MADYRLSPSAQRDLADIWRYTNRQWGAEQANRYIGGIRAICAALAQAPQQGQDCAHIRPGYRRRGADHHMIYFQQTSYGIAIIRILHQRMDATRHF